jgi:hypothetical protein
MSDNFITTMIPNISSVSIIKTVVIIMMILIVLAAIGIWLFIYFKNKKYKEFTVIIFEKDTFGNTHERHDKAGIFLDKKTNLKLLFLKRLKKGLNPNQIPYVTSVDKKGRQIKIIYMVKIGVSNYKFCDVKLDNGVMKFTVGEEDVNWAAQDYETITKTFGQQSFLEKYGGLIAFIVTVIIVSVVLMSLFNKFEVLGEVAKNLDQTAQAMERVANSLNQTVRIQNGVPLIIPGVPGG